MTAPLLTPAEAAQKLRISERGLRRLTRAGDLASVRVGRLVRYREDDLDAYVARQAGRAEPQPAPRPKRRARGGGTGRVVPLFSEMGARE